MVGPAIALPPVSWAVASGGLPAASVTVHIALVSALSAVVMSAAVRPAYVAVQFVEPAAS